jgi:hypothetical protein
MKNRSANMIKNRWSRHLMKEFPHFIPKPSFYHRPSKTVKFIFPIDSESRNEENGTPIEKEENQKPFFDFFQSDSENSKIDFNSFQSIFK